MLLVLLELELEPLALILWKASRRRTVSQNTSLVVKGPSSEIAWPSINVFICFTFHTFVCRPLQQQIALDRSLLARANFHRCIAGDSFDDGLIAVLRGWQSVDAVLLPRL